MSLYRRGRIYWIKITAPGYPPVRESAGTTDEAAAQEYHDKRANELWRVRRLGERARVAFADAAADWIETHAQHKRSFEDDRQRLAVMLPLLPAYLDELTTARLTKIRDELQKPRAVEVTGPRGKTRSITRTVGPKTVNKYLCILSAILKHAHAREQIAAVPAIPTFKTKRRTRGQRFNVLSADQAAAFMGTLPRHLQALARFGLATGLRDANLRQMRWEDIDLGARVARVWGDEAKAGDVIPVPLSDDAVEVLQGELGRHPTFVFTYERIRKRPSGEADAVVVETLTTPKGERVVERLPITKRSNNGAWRKARERAGLPTMRVHDLRHTWATWQKQAGTPDFELQQMGGWADGRMLRTYAHLAASHLLPHANAVRVPRPSTAATVHEMEPAPAPQKKRRRAAA